MWVKSCPKNPTDDPPACPNFACQEVGAEVVLVGKEETALSLRFLEIQIGGQWTQNMIEK